MGWESAISLAASGLGAINTTNNALSQSSAIAQSADYTAQNLANKTSRTEGTLETSFIKSGIALNGAGGPAAIFAQAAAQGNTDIQRTINNANSSISNTMSEARTKALTSIAGGIGKLGSGAITNPGNSPKANPDPSPTGSGTAILDTTALNNSNYGTGMWSL